MSLICEDRAADYYEYAWYHQSLDHEMRWRVTNRGVLSYTTQMRCNEGDEKVWSVVDVVLHSIKFILLARRWWGITGYFGQGCIYAQLNIPALKLATNPRTGTFPSGFFSGIYMGPDCIFTPLGTRTIGIAETRLNYFTATAEIPKLVTLSVNRLFRSMGYPVAVQELEKNVCAIIRDGGG